MNGTSRVTGYSQARFCERLGVNLWAYTRRRSAMIVATLTRISSTMILLSLARYERIVAMVTIYRCRKGDPFERKID